MNTDEDWRAIFEHWPGDLPRQGILTTALDSFSFNDFLLSRGLLLFERDRPDAVGARKVVLAYGSILALKLIDPGPITRYEPLGFSRAL